MLVEKKYKSRVAAIHFTNNSVTVELRKLKIVLQFIEAS